MNLDPFTLRTIADLMRDTTKDELPASPQQRAALTTTLSWAHHLENIATQEDQ